MSKTKWRILYLSLFLLLFMTELLIAVLIHDEFVRPYLGDVLVVLVIYCLVRIFEPIRWRLLPIFIFLFSAVVEFSQYFDLAQLFGLARYKICLLYTSNPDDKILTKTMINNYAKNQLLPPPEKKKYSKEHQLLLIFIYYFKNILSIQDIQDLLFPITRDFFHPGKDSGDYDIKSIYQEVFSLEKGQIEFLKQDIIDKFKHAQETFPEAEAKDQEFLRTFSFVCMLSFDVYVKKMIIEKLIDSLPKENGKDKK